MKQVKKSVLLWYSPREMFDLVVDIGAYPQFLPWCQRAEVLSREGGAPAETVTACLHLAYAGVSQAFTTRNLHVQDESVAMSLVDGPFSELSGSWRFHPLASPGGAPNMGAPAQACKVEFELRYEFSHRALALLVSPVFDRVANTFVDSFVRRAESVYGAR